MQETKADKKKTLRYLKYIFADCLIAFPGLMLVLLIFGEVAMDVATVARPALLAGIMEKAAGDMEHMAGRILLPLVLFCIALLVSPMCNVISHWVFFVAEVHIQKYFGKKMFIFSKQIQLEELENPEILNKFKKAEKALEEQGIVEMLGRTLQTISIIIVCGSIVILVGYYSPWLVVISLAGTVPSLLLQIYVAKIMTALRRGQSMAERRLQYLWELFTRKDAVKEMRTMGFAAYLKEQWTKENEQVLQEYREGVLGGLKKVIIGVCINNLFYAANIAVSLWLMIEGQVSVGEFGGKELSGGEWQKLAIARGLWKDSDNVILDEPTSALDPLVEYDILSKFVEMIQNKTSIIISHRVGVCRTADKIIVMKDGRVVECGKHDELLSKNGEYSRIWSEQAKWYV